LSVHLARGQWKNVAEGSGQERLRMSRHRKSMTTADSCGRASLTQGAIKNAWPFSCVVGASTQERRNEGYGPSQIARILEEDKVEIPSVHMGRYNQGANRNKQVKNLYCWSSSTIVQILQKREYLGHTVNFKTAKHFKDKKSHYVSEDNWLVFENTQEAIIDEATFETVQKVRGTVRRYPDGWGELHPLTGLMYCADCGAKMYVHRSYNGTRKAQYTCSAYGKVPVKPVWTETLLSRRSGRHRNSRSLLISPDRGQNWKLTERGIRNWRYCYAGFMRISFLENFRMDVTRS